MGHVGVGIEQGKDLVSVHAALEGDHLAPDLVGGAGAHGCLEGILGEDYRSEGLVLEAAEHVRVNDGLQVDVGGLVLVGSGLVGTHSQLEHAVVGAQGEVLTLHINPGAHGILVVERALSQLEGDGRTVGGTLAVLDVHFVVDVSALVGGNDLALDPDVLVNGDGTCLVQGLEVFDGSDLLQALGLAELGLGIGQPVGGVGLVDGEHGVPLFLQTLAGSDGRKGGDSK